MKISEMITKDMVREILGFKCIGRFFGGTSIRITDEGIYFHPVRATETGNIGYDLARFLFVDAWDYFREKDWDIKIFDKKSDLGGHITVYRGEFIEYHHTLLITNYPSRLHALASAVNFMWGQENEKSL